MRTVRTPKSERESAAEEMQKYRLVVVATLATVPAPQRLSVRMGIDPRDRCCGMEGMRNDNAGAEHRAEHRCRRDQRSGRYMGPS